MKNLFKIIKISKPLYSWVAILGVFIIINALLAQVSPVLFKFIVDNIEAQIKTGDGDIDRVIFLLVATFITLMVSVLIQAVNNRIGDHFKGELRKFLTEKFYDKVFRLPQTYFDSEISGKIVNQLNRGIYTITDFFNNATNFIIPSLLQALFTIFILAYYNIPIAIFMFILFPIYLGLSYQSTKTWGKREVKKNKHEDISKGRIQEVISNIKLVRGFNNQQNEYDFIENKQTKINDIYAKQSRDFHIFDFLRNTSLNIILLIIFSIVFYSTFQGILSVGTMVLILTLVQQARRPLFAMSFILTQIQQAESGSKEYFEVLDLDTSENYEKSDHRDPFKDVNIKFENVTFSYEENQEVLQDVSFMLDKHEKVALVGHSGAGKSTIINLILKFYKPDSGEIYINDEKYSDLSVNFVRSNISLVFQDNELFSSTIRENVEYGSNAEEDEILQALKKANAYNFVKKLDGGLDAQIGERGVKLSGGQKQRIQIARAILHDAPILILDEATSNLDSKSESLIQSALENLMEDKLVIIIAHRFSTIQNVDKILVIDDGRIVDSGSPKELSQKEGIYKDLLQYQIEGNKKLLKNYDLI